MTTVTPIQTLTRRLVDVDSTEKLDFFLTYLHSPARTRSVVLITPDNRTRAARVDADHFAYALTECAVTARLPTLELVGAYNQRVGEFRQVFNGAIRVIHPSIRTDTRPNSLFLAGNDVCDIDPDAVLRQVKLALHLPGEDDPALAYSTETGDGRSTTGPRSIGSDARSDTRDDARSVDTLRTQLNAAQAQVGALRAQVRSLTDQLSATQTRMQGLGVFDDPQAQFRHEVSTLWLHTYPDAERASVPLREYTLGREFLDSLNSDTHAGIERDKMIAACLEVVTAQVWNGGRRPHQHQVSTLDTTARVREDGATAWRCSVQRNTPGARRLLWWELVDGSVELGRIALHDDMGLH